MTPRERILCFLHSLCGHSSRENSLSTGRAPSTLLANNQICINVLAEHFVHRNIKWPTVDQMEEEANLFVEHHHGPKTIFMVADGTHINGRFWVIFAILS